LERSPFECPLLPSSTCDDPSLFFIAPGSTLPLVRAWRTLSLTAVTSQYWTSRWAAAAEPRPQENGGETETGFSFVDDLFRGLRTYTEGAPKPYEARDIVNNFSLIFACPPSQRRELWQETLAELRADGIRIPEGRWNTPEDFASYLGENGLHFPERFRSIRTALTLVENRDSLGGACPVRPLAVVVTPTADHNGAFGRTGFPYLETLVSSGRFHVIYLEAGTEREMREGLEAIVYDAGVPIHTLVAAGHGTPTSLSLGSLVADPNIDPEEERFLTPEDFLDGDFDGLSDLIAQDGQVLLFSCNNGTGEESGWNMANVWARALPGRRIYSSQVATNIRELEVREDLSLNVTWIDHHPYETRWVPDSPINPHDALLALAEDFSARSAGVSAAAGREAGRAQNASPSDREDTPR